MPPSTIGLIEPIATSVLAVLTARVPAARARVEVDLGLAPGTIPDPADYSLGYHENYPTYPVLIVDGVDHPVVLDSPNYMKSAFTLAIMVIVTAPPGPDPETALTLLLWRYERILIDAIKAAMEAHAFVSQGVGFVLDMDGQRIDYSPTRFLKGDLYARDLFMPAVAVIEEVRVP